MAREPTARTTSARDPGGTRPRRARDSLNRTVILDAALRIAERSGLDGLTFQALGAELGAHATAMYRHFRDKDELVLEMIDELRARSYGVLESTGHWESDLRMQARAIRAHYLRYPTFAQQMAPRATHREVELANTEFALSALVRAGLDEESAAMHLRLFGNYVRAMASLEAAVACQDPDRRARDRLEWEVAVGALDTEEYPHLSRSGTHLLPYDDPRIFELGLDHLIAGIRHAAGFRPASAGVDDEFSEAGDQPGS